MMASVNIATVFGHVICSPPPERNISQQEYISNHLNLMASACDLLVSNYLELYQVEVETDPAYKFIQEKCNDRQAWEQITAGKSGVVQVKSQPTQKSEISPKDEITQITVEPPVVEESVVTEPSTTVIATEEPTVESIAVEQEPIQSKEEPTVVQAAEEPLIEPIQIVKDTVETTTEPVEQEPTLVKSVTEKNEETPEPVVEAPSSTEIIEPPAEEKMPVVDKIEEATPQTPTPQSEEPQPESTVDAIVESTDENH
jgi:hypothetical protein